MKPPGSGHAILEHPTFDNNLEIRLQQANMSTIAGSSQNVGGTSSTQNNRCALHQSPPRAPSLVRVIQGNAELDQIQMQDWDEEVEEDEAAIEEEELIRVQQEVKRLQQEQESIMRRQELHNAPKLADNTSTESG
jgi:hypothetical protein